MIWIFLLCKNVRMIYQYAFGAVLGSSYFALILAIYLLFTSIINGLHPMACSSRVSLLLVNLDRLSKTMWMIFLSIQKFYNQIFQFCDEWNYEIYLTRFLINFYIFCCDFDYRKLFSSQNLILSFGYIQCLHF